MHLGTDAVIKTPMFSRSKETVYFSHSVYYFNSEKEQKIREVLEDYYVNLICPNRDKEKYHLTNESYTYLKTIEQNVDKVYCLELDGYIGRGQFREITFCLSKGIPVYVIRGKEVLEVLEVDREDSDRADQFARIITNGDWYSRMEHLPN